MRLSVGQKAGIPVFSITPGKPDRGTLFDYGADFYQIGKQTGELAVRVLRGADPSQIPITYQVPELLVVNTQALEGLRDSWRVPDDVRRRADVVVDGTGIHQKRSPAAPNLAEGSDNRPQDAVTGHNGDDFLPRAAAYGRV
jgi:putative ABC transport system substrate-binding protein